MDHFTENRWLWARLRAKRFSHEIDWVGQSVDSVKAIRRLLAIALSSIENISRAMENCNVKVKVNLQFVQIFCFCPTFCFKCLLRLNIDLRSFRYVSSITICLICSWICCHRLFFDISNSFGFIFSFVEQRNVFLLVVYFFLFSNSL